jgi:hypothetical protein
LCGSVGSNCSVVVAADNREIEVPVRIDDEFLEFRKNLFHRLDIGARGGDFWRLRILGGDFLEAGGVARGPVDLSFFVGLRLLSQLRRFATRAGNQIIGVTLGFVDEADRVGSRPCNSAE